MSFNKFPHIPRIYSIAFCVMLVVAVCWIPGCKPDSPLTLGPRPKADFAVVNGADANHVIFVNHSSTTSIPYWIVTSTVPPVTTQKLQGDSAKLDLIFMGTYNVTLTVAGQGGLDSVTKSITIDQNDPTACQSGPLAFIGCCTQKTWRLNIGGQRQPLAKK